MATSMFRFPRSVRRSIIVDPYQPSRGTAEFSNSSLPSSTVQPVCLRATKCCRSRRYRSQAKQQSIIPPSPIRLTIANSLSSTELLSSLDRVEDSIEEMEDSLEMIEGSIEEVEDSFDSLEKSEESIEEVENYIEIVQDSIQIKDSKEIVQDSIEVVEDS